MGRRGWWVGSIGASMIAVAGVGCGGGGPPGSHEVIGGSEPDGQAGGTCDSMGPPIDPCGAVATGTIMACGQDSNGQPTQTGYLAIQNPDGSRTYVCATSWGESTGYWFDQPDQFMSDPPSCCGGAASPVAAPTAPTPSIGFLGNPHAPHDIKPQETAQPGNGSLREDPFAIVVQDGSGAAAFQAALPMWNSWAGDGVPHTAPDGSGAYYFPEAVIINYTIIATRDGRPIVVIGPEVSTTSDQMSPLGHPTMGACASGGGAALALSAGELQETTLSNHSGRFGYDASVTQDALTNAQSLFNCLGIPVTTTIYYPPKPRTAP
jgi:hypothetical protein